MDCSVGGLGSAGVGGIRMGGMITHGVLATLTHALTIRFADFVT